MKLLSLIFVDKKNLMMSASRPVGRLHSYHLTRTTTSFTIDHLHHLLLLHLLLLLLLFGGPG